MQEAKDDGTLSIFSVILVYDWLKGQGENIVPVAFCLAFKASSVKKNDTNRTWAFKFMIWSAEVTFYKLE